MQNPAQSGLASPESANTFQFGTNSLRVQLDDAGQPWFNANDVCEALELSNPHKATADHVDPDDLTKREVIDSLGRTQRANHVNESGLYSLILTSRKLEAKRFKRWVTSEVLPSIRRTGGYAAKTAAPLPIPAQAANVIEADLHIANLLGVPIHLAQSEAVKHARLSTGYDVSHLLQYAPAQSNIQDNDIMLEPTELARELGYSSAIAMNKALASAGLQVNNGGKWHSIGFGANISAAHHWNKGGKSGYNLKWNVSKVRQALEAT